MKRYKDSSYFIYEDGRCFSEKSNKFLKPQMTNKYPTYNLTLSDGKRKIYIHRMVAETFLPREEFEEKLVVNHKDGNTHNFNVDNLEWVTPSQNSVHAMEMNLKPKGNQAINLYVSDLPGEEWANIADYPNYSISNKGRVINKKTKRLLKACISNTGYYEVSLWKNNKGSTKQIHPLVYKAFSKDLDLNGYVINHIDGNKLNNCYDNLEKTTSSQNNLHAVYNIKTNACAKEIIQLTFNGEEVKRFASVSQAHKETGINNISRAATSGLTAGGYYWKYVNK